MDENQKELSLEKAFTQLDEIVAKMENRSLPLEDAFEYYQKGVQLLKLCNEKISRVEKQMIEIQGEQEHDVF
jgi:exodeoxyribonuclease VII small subunit